MVVEQGDIESRPLEQLNGIASTTGACSRFFPMQTRGCAKEMETYPSQRFFLIGVVLGTKSNTALDTGARSNSQQVAEETV